MSILIILWIIIFITLVAWSIKHRYSGPAGSSGEYPHPSHFISGLFVTFSSLFFTIILFEQQKSGYATVMVIFTIFSFFQSIGSFRAWRRGELNRD